MVRGLLALSHVQANSSHNPDPVFFLHHTQLDRLWWTWQTRDPEPRMWQYRGRAGNYSSETASLDDILPMGGLAPDIPVSDIIKTEGDTLCYRY